MATEIKLPKLGETMEEGLITQWLVEEGGKVERGQPLFEVQTDKVAMEYESPASGFLLKIVVPAERTVPVLTVVGYLGEPGEAIPGAGESAPVQPGREEAPTAAIPVIDAPAGLAAAAAGTGRAFVSPRARRLAKEAGLDPREFRGTGPNGRVIAADVERMVQNPSSSAIQSDRSGMDRRVPLSPMRKTIARRLTASFASIPHFYLKVTADVTDLLSLRAAVNADVGGISVTDLVLRACALALREFPGINVSLDCEELILHGRVDLGFAVSLDEGLIVPVVKGAERLNLFTLSAAVKDLAARAREGRLAPDECAGATFTVSNLGMYGVEEFSAIINPPAVAILAVGRACPRAVPQGAGFAVRQLMILTLSCDHRAVDGALGARFLAGLRELLEAPYKLVV